MCCAIAALLVAAIAAWRSGIKAALNGRLFALRMAGAAAAILTIAGAVLAARHFDPDAMRVATNDRSLLGEILAMPVCGEKSPRDRARPDIARLASAARN
jgi:hypothetical protein